MAYTTINKSTDNFNTKLYNGTGSSNSITGVGFQPDFTWIKRRNSATNHHLHNAISGATKVLYSNSSAAESTDAQKLSSFDSDGFTVGTNGDANNSAGTFVSWNWKANGSGSTNYDGSITSTVSANTTSGFSIVTYTGTGSLATVGHGLGSAPKMVIAKNRGSTSNWDCYHVGLSGANYRIQLNSTGAESISGGSWGSTAPTSSVFTVQDDTATNISGNTYVAYCFAEKTGYSKFGSYTGNGNADGTFIYTGFKPTMVILKNTSTTGNWQIMDKKRNTDNPVDTLLKPNDTIADQTPSDVKDFLSNGFKLRNAATEDNGSGNTFIYMAFGQSLVGSNNVPCTAR